MANDDKSRRIVTAAAGLFAKSGLRGTAMEAIAAQAQIAKPTLYAYFPDKDAIFEAVSARVIEEWRAAFLDGLRSEGGVVERIGAALAGKAKAARRVREGSAHADDLYGAHRRDGPSQFIAFEVEVTNAIERELILARAARPKLLAHLLLAAIDGIGREASLAELGPAIRLVTERLLVPELPSA